MAADTTDTAIPADALPTTLQLALLPGERRLIEKLSQNGTVDYVRRRSERDYDLEIRGVRTGSCRYSAWLPLLAIRELTAWPSPEIAEMTDYPEMVRQGDWSGVRDSETDRIWHIFGVFVRDALRLQK